MKIDNTETRPVAILHIEALEEVKKLQEKLIEERLKQFFWAYQIGCNTLPFGYVYPTAEEIILRFGKEHFPERFNDEYFHPASIAIRRMLLLEGLWPGDTEYQPLKPGEWDHPYCSYFITKGDPEDKRHIIQGWKLVT